MTLSSPQSTVRRDGVAQRIATAAIRPLLRTSAAEQVRLRVVGEYDVFSRDCGYLFGVARAEVSSTADLRLIGCLAVRRVP
jgi:hypothetical protein